MIHLERPQGGERAALAPQKLAEKGDAMKEKIVLGLSGGVDSPWRPGFQERYEVTGLYLDIGLGGTGRRTPPPWRSGWAFSETAKGYPGRAGAEVCAFFAAEYLGGHFAPAPTTR